MSKMWLFIKMEGGVIMKVLRKYDQFRRDCKADLECESCGHKETRTSAYDDRNYWDNVVPNFKCPKCGKSTKSLGLEPEFIETKYRNFDVV